jgi:hypothetical protein
VLARLDEEGGRPQVVFMSSHDVSDYGPTVSASGARGFIAKDELTGAALRALIG